MSRHRPIVLESTPTAASSQLVTAVTARPVNSSQHGVSAAGQLVIRFWTVTSWPCDELTGSHGEYMGKRLRGGGDHGEGCPGVTNPTFCSVAVQESGGPLVHRPPSFYQHADCNGCMLR